MPGTTSTAFPFFSHDQHHETDAAKRKGGGLKRGYRVTKFNVYKRLKICEVHFNNLYKLLISGDYFTIQLLHRFMPMLYTL